MRVADLMQKDVQTIAPDAPIAELVQMLADYHVSGLPVVTASGKVLGVVTATDVLQASADVNDPETWSQRLENMAVQDLMTSQPHMIGPDANVREAARNMLYADVRRLFVQDNGRLVGVISQTDIAHAVGMGRI